MGREEYLKECVICIIKELRIFVKAAGEFAWVGLGGGGGVKASST